MSQTIIIVGAGAAGLYAARELSKKGYKIIITEANNRVGGRIHTLSPENFNQNVESGAEFIHGKLPITLKLLREANIGYERVGGEMYHVKNGAWSKQQEMAPYWDKLMEKMYSLAADMTIHDFLQQYFSEPKYKDLRQSVENFAQGFDVADTTKASVMAIREEWRDDMEDTFRVTGGYGRLIDYLENECLAAGCELHTSFTVNNIEWKKGSVSVGNGIRGNKAIITVPVGVFPSLQFNPSLDKYKQAARQIGYGAVIKILFQFKESFWNQYADDIGFIFSEEIIPTWWTQSPSQNGLLTGWLGGPMVNRVKGKSKEEIAAIALESLSKTMQRDLRDLLIAHEVYDWGKEPFACGAYSYSTLQTVEARKVFSEPVDDTIYFAGEGYNEGHSAGTVEAGLESGERVGREIE